MKILLKSNVQRIKSSAIKHRFFFFGKLMFLITLEEKKQALYDNSRDEKAFSAKWLKELFFCCF